MAQVVHRHEFEDAGRAVEIQIIEAAVHDRNWACQLVVIIDGKETQRRLVFGEDAIQALELARRRIDNYLQTHAWSGRDPN